MLVFGPGKWDLFPGTGIYKQQKKTIKNWNAMNISERSRIECDWNSKTDSGIFAQNFHREKGSGIPLSDYFMLYEVSEI